MVSDSEIQRGFLAVPTPNQTIPRHSLTLPLTCGTAQSWAFSLHAMKVLTYPNSRHICMCSVCDKNASQAPYEAFTELTWTCSLVLLEYRFTLNHSPRLLSTASCFVRVSGLLIMHYAWTVPLDLDEVSYPRSPHAWSFSNLWAKLAVVLLHRHGMSIKEV